MLARITFLRVMNLWSKVFEAVIFQDDKVWVLMGQVFVSIFLSNAYKVIRAAAIILC